MIKTQLLISILIALLINLNRFLSIVYPQLTYFNDIQGDSILIFFFRMFFFTSYCWLVMYLTNYSTDTFVSKFRNTIIRRGIFILTILLSSKIIYHVFIVGHGFLLYEIPESEGKGISYVWVVMGTTSLLIGWLLKFQSQQKLNEIERERLIKENTQNELMALNNQINPHFLFNSLNTLKYVIQDNPETSIDFVDNLASVYRYILQSKDKGLVSLQKELEVLNGYIYLAKIRFGDNFMVKIELSLHKESTMIPVLSMQLLVENAIKHNEVSKECPLIIKIHNTKDAIIVENKIQFRTQLTKTSKEGLKNLNRRYKLLKNTEITIHESTDFVVALPIH